MSGRGWVLGGCAIAVLSAVACTPPPDYLFVDPRAQPVRVELRKSFGRFSYHYAPVAISECVFYENAKAGGAEEHPYPEELWRVLSVAPDRPVIDLRYGSLPPGFLQSTPASTPPAPLQPGHRYSVECSGDTAGMAEFEIPEAIAWSPPAKKPREAARSTRRPDDRRARESSP